MAEIDSASGESEGEARRIAIELFIVHPSLTPPEITAALGLEGHVTQWVGEPRATPRRAKLQGVHRDTRWRHTIRHELREQWFADKVTELVDRLLPHRDFLHTLRATGGSADIVVQFLDVSYFGDRLPVETLAKMSELGLGLDIAVYNVPQSL